MVHCVYLYRDAHPHTANRILSTVGKGYDHNAITLVLIMNKFIVKKSVVMVDLSPNWVATEGCERIQCQLCIMVVKK